MFAVLYQSFLNYNKNNNSQFTTTTTTTTAATNSAEVDTPVC